MFQAYEEFMTDVRVGGNIVIRKFVYLGCRVTKGIWFHNLWEICYHLKLTIDLDVTLYVKLTRM